MHQLLDGIPLDTMNTSMTINATAAWLLSLYITTAQENGVDQKLLSGTTQNDIIKEFLARGTYAFPPGPSMRLIADMVAYTVTEVPKWNPINICSYHLQEAGATPVQEIAYAMSNAIAVLDAVRERVSEDLMPKVFARISFFVNAGVRFVEEHAKLRAMGVLDQRCDLGLDHVRAVEEVVVLEQVGLEGQHLLHAQRPLLVPRTRQAERLVPGRQLHRAGARVLRQRDRQHLEQDAGDVVFRLLLGQPQRIDLHAIAEKSALRIGDTVTGARDFVPQFGEGAHLADFGDEAQPRIHEK
jgi:hypothetical protein